jgi:hypothetical protein
MPTKRPRYTVTETDALRHALEGLARRHPELAGDRNALFRRLVDEAVAPYDGDREARRARVREGLRRLEARGLRYPEGYLDSLRQEWPA